MSIHHVTAIASDPQRTLDFHAGLLGLRLVKLTVNYDDPDNYHYYFGDELGRPGTILTFFPWPADGAGRPGLGWVNQIGLGVPRSALGFWVERLLTRGVPYEGPFRRFDEQVLAFRDPDGVLFESAAAGPGFTVDEPPAELGSGLCLPPAYEPDRERIVAGLPPVRIPHLAAPEI